MPSGRVRGSEAYIRRIGQMASQPVQRLTRRSVLISTRLVRLAAIATMWRLSDVARRSSRTSLNIAGPDMHLAETIGVVLPQAPNRCTQCYDRLCCCNMSSAEPQKQRELGSRSAASLDQ